jgi:hypothetical protein
MGAVVWELLDHPLSAAELDDAAAALVGERAGLGDSVAELIEAGLVVSLPGG